MKKHQKHPTWGTFQRCEACNLHKIQGQENQRKTEQVFQREGDPIDTIVKCDAWLGTGPGLSRSGSGAVTAARSLSQASHNGPGSLLTPSSVWVWKKTVLFSIFPWKSRDPIFLQHFGWTHYPSDRWDQKEGEQYAVGLSRMLEHRAQAWSWGWCPIDLWVVVGQG